jgi:hypothetical protein
MMLKEIDFEEWDELINCHPMATLFHTKEWLKILKEGFPWTKVKLYALINRHGKPLGVVPVELTRKLLFLLAGSPLPGLFTPYQGPLSLNSSDIDIGNLPTLIAQTLKPHFLAIAIPPDRTVCPAISVPPGWTNQRTILVDLKEGVDQLWRNLKSETRNEVRQAQRRGVEIYEPTSLDQWLRDYWEMHKTVYSQQNMKPPGSLEFYKALWDHLYSKGQLKVVLAKYQGKTIAGGIFPIYRDTIYFLDGASFREYGPLRGNNLIQWHILCWASTAGLRIYDMVGANIPSIARFKRGFGGTETGYPYFRTTYRLWGKIGFWMYERFRPFLKRLGA